MSLELFKLVDTYIKDPSNLNQFNIEELLKKNHKLFYSINEDNYNIFQYIATGLSIGKVNVKILDIIYKIFKLSTIKSFLDSGKDSPLHIAIHQQEYQIVKYLIENTNINMEVKNSYNQTPIFYCVNQDDNESCSDINIEIVKLLLFRGAYVNILDNFNKTPLYYAIKNKCIPIIILLLKAGAKIIYNTNKFETIDIRTKTNSIEIKNILNKYYKKQNSIKNPKNIINSDTKEDFKQYMFLCNHLDTIDLDLLYTLADNLKVNTYKLTDLQICSKISEKMVNKRVRNQLS